MLIWLLKTPTYDERRRLVSWKSLLHTFPFLFACHPGKLSSFLTLFWNWNSRRIYRRILLLDLPPTHAKIIQAKFQEERASKKGAFVPLSLWPRTIKSARIRPKTPERDKNALDGNENGPFFTLSEWTRRSKRRRHFWPLFTLFLRYILPFKLARPNCDYLRHSGER